VVGERTYGDASVRRPITMDDGGAIILSVAKYYSPSGKAIQDVAITPNVLIADTDDDAAAPDEEPDSAAPADENKVKAPQTDEQLRKAIEVLKKRETKA